MRLALAGAVLTAALAGCAAPLPSTDPVPAPTVATPASTPVPPAAAPTAVTIPAVGAASSLIRTGLRPDGQLEVPDVATPEQASWWDGSPEPGQPGPAVLLGHVDGDGGRPGVFARLAELRPGDEVLVDRADAATARFVIDRVLQVPKASFPTSVVYRDTVRPELRLITCGGDFDRLLGHYRDQVIVFAHLQEGP